MNTNRSNIITRTHIIKLIIVIFTSVLVSFIGATIFSNDIIHNLKEMADNRNTSELILNTNNFENNGYELNETGLVAIKDDPGLSINNVNMYVSDITIFLTQQIDTNIDVQIYYTTADEAFNADEALSAKIAVDQQSLKINFNKSIKNLRIDFGNLTGEKIPLNKIVLNEKIQFSYILDLFKNTINSNAFTGIWNDRFTILFISWLFIGLHFILNITKMYDWIWRRRWLVGGLLLLFLVVNKYHGDSMSIYDYTIQPGLGDEFVEPVFGIPREIRSDEWIVSTPYALASHFGDTPYSKYNSILRGTDTLNIVAGISRSYAGLAMPHKFLASFLPIEYGFSFLWYSQIIFTFLISLEFCYIIGKKNRLLATTGAFLIACSSFYMWWGFPLIIATAEAAIVGVNCFIENQSKLLKVLYGIGIALAGACFVTILYPAWQVPIGYAFLGILIWLLYDKWDRIKKLDKKDWFIVTIMILFMCSLIIAYLLEAREYMQAILNTVYPGKRQSNGEYALDKLFYYFISPLLPHKNFPNPSETGTFINFFPIPLIAGIVQLTGDKKEKKNNLLLSILICISIFILIYVTTGLPHWFASLSLMSYSIAGRAVDILGLLQIYLIIVVFSQKDKMNNIKPLWSVGISCTAGIIAFGVCQKYFSAYFSKFYSIIMLSIIVLTGYCILSEISKKVLTKVLFLLIFISVINVAQVRPIVKGISPIYSKPLATEISKILDKENNTKWIAYGDITNQSFIAACGAPAINFVNYYPNMELWTSLDPVGVYNKIYNRYAHVIIAFTDADTSFETIQPDLIQLNLSYKDITKTKATYIFSLEKLDVDNSYVQFKTVYSEAGSYIYAIHYK